MSLVKMLLLAISLIAKHRILEGDVAVYNIQIIIEFIIKDIWRQGIWVIIQRGDTMCFRSNLSIKKCLSCKTTLQNSCAFWCCKG
jgi:hypothetical protein